MMDMGPMQHHDFLSRNGWGDADILPVTSDWSPRKYFRLGKRGATAILLQSAPDHDPASLAGHKLGDFVRLAGHFAHLGLHTPEIYAADPQQGYLLLEDFGDITIESADVEKTGYETAVDALAILREHPDALATALIRYHDGHVHRALRFFPEYYAQEHYAREHGRADIAGWLDAWAQVEAALPACPQCLTHIDWKAGNLHWLPGFEGLGRLGVLDFQGAVIGPFVYDIANLLEDARRNLSPELKKHLIDRFRARLPADMRDLFDAWYPVIAAQFHARVAGQAIKLAQEKGRADMLALVPRLEAYLRPAMQLPVLAPVAAWITHYTELLK